MLPVGRFGQSLKDAQAGTLAPCPGKVRTRGSCASPSNDLSKMQPQSWLDIDGMVLSVASLLHRQPAWDSSMGAQVSWVS